MKRLLFLFLLFLIPRVARAQVPVVSVLPANCSVGQQVSFLGTVYTCTAIDTWTPGASGVSLPTTLSVQLARGCGNQSNCFSVNWDAQETYNATFSSGSPTVTTATGDPPFVASDVGKTCYGTNADITGFESQLSSVTVIPECTILTFVNAHQITVSQNANANCSTTGSCLFRWGHDDTAVLQQADNALGCGTLILPPGATMISAAWMTEGAPTCSQNVNAGPSVIGAGNTATRFFIRQDFNYASCTLGRTGKACFALPFDSVSSTQPAQGLLADFGISGGGISNLGGKANIGVEIDGQNLRYVNINAWGANDGPCIAVSNQLSGCFFGFESTSFGSSTDTLDEDGAGAVGCVINGPQNYMRLGYCGDNAKRAADFYFPGSFFVSIQSTFGPFASSTAACATNIATNGAGSVWQEIGDWNHGPGLTAGSAQACTWDSGDQYVFTSSQILGAGGTNGNGFAPQVSGSSGVAADSIFSGSGTGGPLNLKSGTSFFDSPTNSFIGSSVVVGTWHHTESGTCTFAASTTCAITFAHNFGSTPSLIITPVNPVSVTVTVTALSSTAATLTASTSTSIAVSWTATL